MSIGTQKTMLKDYAKRNGFLNCQFYVDDGYSGTNYDRPVVELIFSIAKEDVGLHTICNRLRKAKVIKPSFYKKELFERYIDEEKMYDWDTTYVSKILHDPVYARNLIVVERPTKTMCSKKRQYIPFAEREVIYGIHKPIIEQNR